MKQLKKQLELTSQHYAYMLTPSNSSNVVGGNNNNHHHQHQSAPVANYHFNELISKLYYALSLWVDETRLHDTSLYLPALPVHYEPNLLAKVFTRQCDFWTEYIDLRRINDHISHVVAASQIGLWRINIFYKWIICVYQTKKNLKRKKARKFIKFAS